MRAILIKSIAAIWLGLMIGSVNAVYPDQPIKLVVGFPPGGGGDLYGRLIAGAMSKTMGQTMVVENRPGAGGNIAADIVAKAKPDGYTILLAMSGNLAVAPAFKAASLPYRVPDDFSPIGLILEAPHGLFVANNSKFTNAKQVFEASKQSNLTFASTGTGAAAHIGMEMIKQRAGLEILHVPYKGSGPAITDMIGGQVDLFFATAPPLVGQVRQEQIRILALTSEKRSAVLPQVPTFKELGINVVVTQWYGLVAPAGTPAPILKYLSQHLTLALNNPEVKQSIRKDAAFERNVPLLDFKLYIEEDIARYRAAISDKLLKEIAP